MNHADDTLHPIVAERKATAIVDGKLHGLKVKLGLARAKANQATCLAEKIAAKDLEKTIQADIRQAYRSYYDDIDALLASWDDLSHTS
jgi:hypothetical protein